MSTIKFKIKFRNSKCYIIQSKYRMFSSFFYKIFYTQGVPGLHSNQELTAIINNFNAHAANYSPVLAQIRNQNIDMKDHLASVLSYSQEHITCTDPVALAKFVSMKHVNQMTVEKADAMFHFTKEVSIRADLILCPRLYPSSTFDPTMVSRSECLSLNAHLNNGTMPALEESAEVVKAVSKKILIVLKPHVDVLPSLADLCSLSHLNPALTTLVLDHYLYAAVGPAVFFANYQAIFFFKSNILETCRDQKFFEKRIPYMHQPNIVALTSASACIAAFIYTGGFEGASAVAGGGRPFGLDLTDIGRTVGGAFGTFIDGFVTESARASSVNSYISDAFKALSKLTIKR